MYNVANLLGLELDVRAYVNRLELPIILCNIETLDFCVYRNIVHIENRSQLLLILEH